MSDTTEVRVPDIGDFSDVPVIEIHVSPGDEVAVEDPLVTLESDKATMDVPAPIAGTVRQLRVDIGDRVSEGSVLLVVEPSSSDGAAASDGAVEAEVAVVDEHPPPGPDDEEYEVDVVVIGSGPGGYTAAFRAADLGLKTVMIEREETLGGVCLNVGCIPSKALLHAAKVIAEAEEMSSNGVSFEPPSVDLAKLLEWKQSAVSRLTGGIGQLAKARQVEVVRGEASFVGAHAVRAGERQISFRHCIIATGSSPVRLPFIPEDPRVVDSTGALSPSSIPSRMLVIGGGIIGLEMATVYDALGTSVTVVELMDQIIPGCDKDLVKPLHKRITGRYAAVRTGVEVRSVSAGEDGLRVEFSEGEPETFDLVLVAVGRVPNGRGLGAEEIGVHVDERGFIPVDSQMRTNVGHVFAIGDVCGGPMLAHKATHEGKTAAEVIAGDSAARFDARAIPSVAYTDPEVAWMGLTEIEASERGIEVEKAVFPWSASGRALSIARTEGMTKLLTEPGTGRLLGAGMVGPGAGELIAETVHALEMGANAEDIALTIHPHPTLSETVGLAAEVAHGTVTDLPPKRRSRAAKA
jgi:dihydrolipoamide dehydrogenase